MSIAVLHQVFDETRRLAIAGSNLAQDDFRLKKLIPPLEASGKKAPVFSKVAAATQLLVDAKPNDSAGALLDLSSLVMAILYTQGELGAEGKLQPIKPVGIELTSTQTPARLLKPVIEALTTTGSGRLETVREAFERGAFKDPRLVNHAIAGLDDVYGEMADFMERKVVIAYGQAITPLIEDRINLSGRGGDSRRLRLLHRLDPAKARPLVLEAFEKGSKEMKLAALACLGDSPDDLVPLIEQTKAKAAEVRTLAIRRLLKFDQPEVIELLEASLDGKDANNIAHFFRGSKSKELLTRLVAKWNTAYDALTGTPVKQRTSAAEKKELEATLRHLLNISFALPFRNEKQIEQIVQRVLDDCDTLVAYKSGNVDGGEIIDWASQWIAICGLPALKNKLATMQATIPEVAFDECVSAALDVLTPKVFFDTFSPIYLENVPTRKEKGKLSKRDLHSRHEILTRAMQSRSPVNVWRNANDEDDIADTVDDYDDERYRYPRRPCDKPVTFDPRWITAAIKQQDDDLLLAIATDRDKDAAKYLESQVQQMIANKKDDSYDAMHRIKKLAMCKHKGVENLVLELIKSVNEARSKAKAKPRHGYGSLYWLGQALPYLSSAQCKTIQSSLEGMHESIIDEMLMALHRAEEVRSKMK